MAIRVSGAARILGLSPSSVRNRCADGSLKYSINAAGQKIFDLKDLEEYYAKQTGQEQKELPVIFYVRSSDGNDVTMETQVEKLTENYGEPTMIYRDKASGLNENRKGLKNLMAYSKTTPCNIYVTDKDRLTRFGWTYLEEYFKQNKSNLTTLNHPDTKEPQEVLLKDFMTLFASFSGKFYRLRGWKEQKQFLKKVEKVVKENETKRTL